MACSKEFLNFEPTEKPKWRERLPKGAQEPSISEMINDIVSDMQCYGEAKSKGKLKAEKKVKSDFELLLSFLLNVQNEEGIGLKDAGTTEDVVQALEDAWSAGEFENIEELIKVITELRGMLEKNMIKWKKKIIDSSSQLSSDSSSSQDNNDASEEIKSKKQKLDVFEPPCYPSLGDTEDKIASHHEAISKSQTLSKDLRETVNLYRGYKHLAQEIDKIKKRKLSLYLGMIDVDICILESHKILMDTIMDVPGTFSTNHRSARFKGTTHTYPMFATEDLARTAVQTLVDKYVDMVEEIRKIPDVPENKQEKIQKSFKCASVFLFGFLTLHPFGDGNGRLARLLCSYCLFTFSPFLTPIFNVFSSSVNEDYVEALVEARQGLKLPEYINTEHEAKAAAIAVLCQKPRDLCALIIESNRCMWREYLTKLNL